MQKRLPTYALAAFVGVLVAGGMFFGVAYSAHAQAKKATPKTITLSELTPANGWECTTGKTSCTNNKKDSPWYKGTASCTTTMIPSGNPGIPDTPETSCTATAADGTSATGTVSDDYATGVVTTTKSTADANGNTTSVDATQTTSPIVSAVEGAGEAASSAAKCLLSGPVSCLITTVGSSIWLFATFLLGLAGVLFNLVVVKTVFQFSTVVGNSPGLLLAWGIVRDLGNMLLLFGFVFMGIATVLNLNSYTVKKTLPNLIIFAILMNFSLFTAEAVIDTSNVLSSVLYAQSNSYCSGLAGTSSVSGDASVSGSGFSSAVGSLTSADKSNCMLNYGIGGSIMQASGLSSMFVVPHDVSNLDSITVYIGLSLFAAVGAIVLFAATIMLIYRTVALIFVMMLSPIGFAGSAVPILHGAAKKWWDTLFREAFFAPLMILMILVSLKVAESFSTVSGNGGLAAALMQPNSSVMGIVLVFFLVIGLLVGSLMAAKSFGSMGAGLAISTATKFVRTPFSAASGFAGRNTFGRAGGWAQKAYQQAAGNPNNKVLGGLARSNFLGFHSAVMGATGAVKNATYGGSKSYADSKKESKERKSHLAHEAEKAAHLQELNAAMQSNNPNRNAAIASALQKMNQADISEYLGHATPDQRGAIARALSPDKFEDLLKDKELGADAKEDLIHNRWSELDTQIQARDDTGIRRWSAKDLELVAKHSPEMFDRLIRGQNANGDSLISGDQFDALTKSNALTYPQKQLLRDESRGARIDALLAQGNSAAAIALIRNIGGSKNVAKLSGGTLVNPAIAGALSANDLRAIMTEDKLSDPQRRALARVVRQREAAGEQEIIKLLNPPANNLAAGYYTP